MQFNKEIFLLLSILYLAQGDSSGEDDDGEMTVPRSPRISGESTVRLTYSIGEELHKLVCEIEGSPTPMVAWFKDGKKVSEESYETEFDVEEGKATLEFKKDTVEEKTGGNYSCIAANFLGRASKTFILSVSTPKPPPPENVSGAATHQSNSSQTTKSNKPTPQIKPEEHLLRIKK